MRNYKFETKKVSQRDVTAPIYFKTLAKLPCFDLESTLTSLH